MSSSPVEAKFIARRIIWAVCAILSIILAIRLARWQGSKADAKMHMMQLYAIRQQQPVETVSSDQWNAWLKGKNAAWLLKRVRFTGKPLGSPIYQWNAYQGKWGQCVYGVLELQSGYGVLTKLGWRQALLNSRAVVDWIPFLSHGHVQTENQWEGQLQMPEKRWALTDKTEVKPGQAIERIDMKAIARAYHIKLFPGVVELPPQGAGCESLLPTDVGMQRNRSYQYQWYAIAVLIAVLYWVYGYKRHAI